MSGAIALTPSPQAGSSEESQCEQHRGFFPSFFVRFGFFNSLFLFFGRKESQSKM
jgi:hypothetical protein